MTALLSLALLQDNTSTGISPLGAGLGIGVMICYFAVIILMIAGMWGVFVKAGKPGWAAIIPIYNMIVLLEITGKPIWWFILMLIPLVNIIVYIIVLIELARRFGKGIGFAIGLLIFPFICFPILGFGSAQYHP